jgi:hypothetical protein
MAKITKKTKPEPNYSIKARKSQPRLDASQNEPRVVEQAIGGKLVEKKQR